MNEIEINELINVTGEANNVIDVDNIKKILMRKLSPSKANDLKKSFSKLINEYKDKLIEYKKDLSDDEYELAIRCYLSSKEKDNINCSEQLESFVNSKIIPYDDCIPTLDDYFNI